MKHVSVEDVLRQGNDGSGRPRTLLYEVFEKCGKPLAQPVFEWSYGDASFPTTQAVTDSVQKLLAEGVLTRGPGQYQHHLGGHAQKLSLTHE